MASQIQLARVQTGVGGVLFDSNGYPVWQPFNGASSVTNTYGLMQARIADEVLGSPTTAHIQNAIQDAIKKWERRSFYFNEMRFISPVTGSSTQLQTAPGQEYYSQLDYPALIQWVHLEKINVFAFNARYSLEPRTPQWMDDHSFNPSWQGLPTDWCWQSQALRLYPIPDNVYPIILTGTCRFAPLVNSGDYNPWTDDAERLIRSEAKRILFASIIRSVQDAQIMATEVQDALNDLDIESTKRAGGPGKIRPSRGFM